MGDEDRAECFVVTPVGWVRSPRRNPADTDRWGSVMSTVEVDQRFGDECLIGLADFSHVEIVFVFDRAVERNDYRGAATGPGSKRLPRVGIFCSRGPNRPNRIGVSTCRLVGVDKRELTVAGLDAVDGTPVLDIKPIMIEMLPPDVRQPDWVSVLLRDYQQP
jgi:tRNA-Thr(GGU) m(6)t(6)A37 methyltransferase TsaA